MKSDEKLVVQVGKNETLGDFIQKCRQQYGWSQEELGWRTGITREHVGRIERGKCIPSVQTLYDLEKALNLPECALVKRVNAQNQNRVRQRISQASIDPDKYEYIPAKEQNDHVKADQYQQVAIYARVSTDNPMQTTSFELQQKYYEELVAQHPQWVLVKIYADEGKSGTTMQHRDGFNEMLADANAGKIDLIIVKNISRFARNVVDCLSIIRKLSEKKIGVLFESEAIYSLNDDSHMALSFQATIAEQESRTRSRSMETSLRMRLDHGLPLTPELLGFVKNEDGKLVVNPETYKIPKLMFYMYLYGYSTQQITSTKAKNGISAVSTLERIYDKYGQAVLDRTLRLAAATWEGENNSFSGNILMGIARIVVAYGDTVRDDVFKDHVGRVSVKAIIRAAKERRPGALGYSEAMIIEYNKKSKFRLSLKTLYGGKAMSGEDDFGEE